MEAIARPLVVARKHQRLGAMFRSFGPQFPLVERLGSGSILILAFIQMAGQKAEAMKSMMMGPQKILEE